MFDSKNVDCYAMLVWCCRALVSRGSQVHNFRVPCATARRGSNSDERMVMMMMMIIMVMMVMILARTMRILKMMMRIMKIMMMVTLILSRKDVLRSQPGRAVSVVWSTPSPCGLACHVRAS